MSNWGFQFDLVYDHSRPEDSIWQCRRTESNFMCQQSTIECILKVPLKLQQQLQLKLQLLLKLQLQPQINKVREEILVCVCISFHWQPLYKCQKRFKMLFLHEDLFVDKPVDSQVASLRWLELRLGLNQKIFTWPLAGSCNSRCPKMDYWQIVCVFCIFCMAKHGRQTINPPPVPSD